MQLTMTGEYALRAVLFMCSYPTGTRFKISEVSEKNDIPENFLRKIIVQLKNNHFVTGQKGNGGGIYLSIPPEQITPLDIIEAVEGNIALNKCLIQKDTCSRDEYCSVHEIWFSTQQMLRTQLASKNMLELAKQNDENRLLRKHKKN